MFLSNPVCWVPFVGLADTLAVACLLSKPGGIVARLLAFTQIACVVCVCAGSKRVGRLGKTSRRRR